MRHKVDPRVGERMRRVRTSGTAPELAVRRLLDLWRIQYLANDGLLPGTPDIVLVRERVAVFVHGCFWHGHRCIRRLPRTNVPFWEGKIAGNRSRDRRAAGKLRAMGWQVVTLWECRTKDMGKLEQLMTRKGLLK